MQPEQAHISSMLGVLACQVRKLTNLRRVELAQLLIDEARRLDTEGRTHFHFQAPLQSLDLERRVARFGAAEGGATEACPCGLLALAALAIARPVLAMLPAIAARACVWWMLMTSPCCWLMAYMDMS